MFDEFVPVPTRKISCRLIVSHAGFENESELLRELYVRGLKTAEDWHRPARWRRDVDVLVARADSTLARRAVAR